jgi:hypothetical protein
MEESKPEGGRKRERETETGRREGGRERERGKGRRHVEFIFLNSLCQAMPEAHYSGDFQLYESIRSPFNLNQFELNFLFFAWERALTNTHIFQGDRMIYCKSSPQKRSCLQEKLAGRAGP